MYKIVGIDKAGRTGVPMFIMLSFEKAVEICELLGWEWIDAAGNSWEMCIAKQ